jgi:hypothetical protein
MRMKLVLIISILVLVFGAARAQTRAEKWGVGGHLFISLPQQGFNHLSQDGEGIGGKLYYRFNPYLALRSDLSYISYGERRESEMISYGYILVTRRNESFQLTLGPQLTWRKGVVTPYAAAMGGLYFYHGVVTVDDYYGYYYPYTDSFGSQTKWGYNLGGGLLFDIGLGPQIDLGFKYQHIIDAETTINEVKVKQTGIDYCVTIGVVFFRD